VGVFEVVQWFHTWRVCWMAVICWAIGCSRAIGVPAPDLGFWQGLPFQSCCTGLHPRPLWGWPYCGGALDHCGDDTWRALGHCVGALGHCVGEGGPSVGPAGHGALLWGVSYCVHVLGHCVGVALLWACPRSLCGGVQGHCVWGPYCVSHRA